MVHILALALLFLLSSVALDDAKADELEEASSWRYDYIEECTPGFRVLVDDGSLDQRLANIIYTSITGRPGSSDVDVVDMGGESTNVEYMRKAAGKEVNEQQCQQELSQMIQLVEELNNLTVAMRSGKQTKPEERHIRLARVLDSFGRYQGGGFTGNYWYPGIVDQCVDTILELESDRKVNTRYCTVRLDLESSLNQSLVKRKRAIVEGSTAFSVGICLPRSCHMINFPQHRSLIQHLVDSQFEMPPFFIKRNLEVKSLYCTFDSDSQLAQLPISTKLYLTVATLWLSLLVYFTYKQNTQVDREVSPIRTKKNWIFYNLQQSLDIRSSISDLLQPKSRVTHKRINLNTTDLIKVFGCISVVLGHTLVLKQTAVPNLLTFLKFSERDPWLYNFYTIAMLTDTFFAISGMLVTYITLKKLYYSNRGKLNQGIGTAISETLLLITVRYLRLVPTYAAVHWLFKSLFTRMGSGPFWNDGLNKNTPVGGCQQESWLSPLIGLSAYRPLATQCMAQAWSVANDILIFFILAPIIVLISRRAKLGIFISLVLALASSFIVYRDFVNIDPTMAGYMTTMKPYVITAYFSDLAYLYTSAHYRPFVIFIGVVSGYVLFHYAETGYIRQWPAWFKGPATKLSLFIFFATALWPSLFTSFRGDERLYDAHLMSIDTMGLSIVLSRWFWSLTNVMLILRLVTDWKDGAFARFSAHYLWSIMVKLSYSILLLHVHVLTHEENSAHVKQPLTKINLINTFSSCLFKSVLLSVPLFTLVENPINKFVHSVLERLLLNSKVPKQSASHEVSTESANNSHIKKQ